MPGPVPGSVGLQPDGTGQKVDVLDLNNGTDDVVREVATIGDPTNWDQMAEVTDAIPASNASGMVTRNVPGGIQDVNLVGGGITTAPTDFQYGTAVLAPLATGTLITLTAAGTMNLWGFHGSGDGDGFFQLQVNGSTKMAGRIMATEPSVSRVSSAPKVINPGDVVDLIVTASGRASANYEGEMIVG